MDKNIKSKLKKYLHKLITEVIVGDGTWETTKKDKMRPTQATAERWMDWSEADEFEELSPKDQELFEKQADYLLGFLMEQPAHAISALIYGGGNG